MASTLARVVEELDPLDSEERRQAARSVVRQLIDAAQVLLRLPNGSEYPLDGKELRALVAVVSARADGQRVSVVSHDVMLSPQQAAELLGVSRPMVYRFIERGDLDATRIGTHWRLLSADVLALAGHRARLAEKVDAGFDRIAEVMTSRMEQSASDQDAKESWREVDAEQRAASPQQ